MIRVGLAVHSFHPHIGGSEAHVRWMAGSLFERGFSPLVVTRRASADPCVVEGIEITTNIADVLRCDVVLTYSASTLTQEVGAVLRATRARPPWIHHPCAVSRFGRELIHHADCILAFNARDVELAASVCGNTAKVARVFPGAHHERCGRPGRVRNEIGCEYILWAGAWTHAKGARLLAERFTLLRRRYNTQPLKLVMFGAGGGDERLTTDDDIVVVDGNWTDVPDALADCAFLAFNSPGPPVGYDANPIILLEAMMNGRTFIAQSGTAFLNEIADLGLLVDTDEQWVEAAQTLWLNPDRRGELERKCAAAYRDRYNLTAMMDGVEEVIRRLQRSG